MLQRYILRPIALGIQSFRLHKLRSLLTVLGVVFGVASVIVMMAIGEGARSEAIRAIEQLGATNIIIRSVKPSHLLESAETLGAIRYGLTFDDLRSIEATLPRPNLVVPTRDHRRDIWHHEHRLSGRVVGVTPNYRQVHDVRIEEGRFVTQLDMDSSMPVAVLGSEVAKRLFPLTNPIGKTVRIGSDRYFRVIGVLRSRSISPGLGGSLPAEDYGTDAYIPLSTDQKYFGENVVFERGDRGVPEKVEISQLIVTVPETRLVTPSARIVRSLIDKAKKGNETAITVPLDLLEKAEQTQRIFTLVLGAIASISLLVGGIGIMNIMLATVTERTREIGIRRALGAYRIDIITQFLLETAVLSCSGGILGIVLGLSASHAASTIVGIDALVRPWSPIVAFLISIFVGILFGIYPAYRAAKMSPVEALRSE
jgi:putative ABC transport system permease protein